VAKKKSGKKTENSSVSVGSSFNPESFKYYVPVLIAILLVGVTVLFSDFIFSDKMLHGSDTINAGIFFRHFYVEYFQAHGSVPVWNPYIFGGLPFVDAFHGDTYYPLSIYKFFGNFYRALGLNLVFHIFLAGIFMYFTARQFRLSRVAATMSAIAYAFSGVLISLVAPGHDGKIFVITLFPLTVLFLDRAFEKKPFLNFTLLGLVIGTIILSPHPQLSYYALWALAFYGIFKMIVRFRDTKSIASIIKPGALLAYAVVIGLLISAVQFFPGYVYTTEYSPRADTKSGYEWATSWSLHTEEAFGQVVPEFAGADTGEGDYYWGKNAFKDNSEYVGVIPLFLAMIGIFFFRKKETWFFGGLALFAFIYALGDTTPIFRVFYYIIPKVKSLRAPSTIMFVYLFSISLLAGYGIQFLIDKRREMSAETRKKLSYYLFGVPAVVLLFTFLFSAAGETMLSIYTSIFYSGIKSAMVSQTASKWNVALLQLPNIVSGFWVAAFLLIGSAAAVYLYLNKKAGVIILLLVPLLGMIDGIRYNSKFIKTYDPTREFSPNPVSNFVDGLPGYFRVGNFRSISANFFPFFGIPVVTGYHGNQLRWYDDLLGGPGAPNQFNPRVQNLVGARYIIIASNAQLPPNYFGPDSVRVIRDFGGVKIYQNDNALPRAFLTDRYQVIPDRHGIYPEIIGGTSNLRELVYLEEKPPPDIIPVDSGAMTAEIVSYAIDSVLINVKTDQNAMLVLTDNYYPKWEAFVDGDKTNIYRAYGSFRAVPVKSGQSSVLFKYDHSANDPYFYTTLLTLILVGIILLFHLYLYLMRERKTETV